MKSSAYTLNKLKEMKPEELKELNSLSLDSEREEDLHQDLKDAAQVKYSYMKSIDLWDLPEPRPKTFAQYLKDLFNPPAPPVQNYRRLPQEAHEEKEAVEQHELQSPVHQTPSYRNIGGCSE